MQGAEGLAAKAAEAIATRDAIQANLLELDGSYGKRLLDGAPLRGVTRQKWEAAAAKLADLWQTYTAYAAVIDRLAELTQARRPKGDSPELIELLTGRCVTLTQSPAPLARRDLADSGRRELTLTAAVAAMRGAFSDVTEVTAAAEAVWNDLGGRLDAVAARLAGAHALLGGLGDDGIAARLASAADSLDIQRAALNSDPLALWGAHADTSAADRLAGQAAALADEIAALDRLRREARDRIDQVRAQADVLAAARRDAAAAWQRAAVRITGVPPLPPAAAPPPLDGLDALAAAGRWRQLAAEIDGCASALARTLSQTRDAERSLVSLIAQRDELRGLLEAYKAKAARLGAAPGQGLTAQDLTAQDLTAQDLTARYDHARDLLWTAPCDLAAAARAVTGYQHAILAMEGQRR
ncbi:MAG TPA: hypothetical protein VG142_00410 [Trebonia sp.]|nr:hypothetical protein [Trebonia sp.]